MFGERGKLEQYLITLRGCRAFSIPRVMEASTANHGYASFSKAGVVRVGIGELPILAGF